MREPRSTDEELFKRVLLSHRFGLENRETSLKGNVYSVEDLPFDIALSELKKSFTEFMTSKDHIEKLLILLRTTFSQKIKKFSIKESNIIMHTISSTLMDFYTEDYFSQIPNFLQQNKIVIAPLKTFFSVEGTKNVIEYIKAVVIFEDRLIKLNGLGSMKIPGLRVYRTQPFDHQTLLDMLDEFHHSFELPLAITCWDKKLNELTQPEKIRHITKKEQAVGNGSWLTCKLLMFAIVFATIFKFCKAQGLKDLQIDPLASTIAESWYKLFIVDDRNRAVQEYLDLHNFMTTLEPLSVVTRIQNIKAFLKVTRSSAYPADREILNNIYLKSLNWLLADYLKKGDIGEAYALIEQEATNKSWNPLFYAAKNGKVAIAEILASNANYITDRDRHGNTPLHSAAMHGRFEICKMFLRYKNKNKIEIDAQNNKGDTALHCAIRRNKLDIAELLIKEAPHIIDVRNHNNETALKIACDHHRTDAVERLLLKGASAEGLIIEDYPQDIQKILKNPPKPLVGPFSTSFL